MQLPTRSSLAIAAVLMMSGSLAGAAQAATGPKPLNPKDVQAALARGKAAGPPPSSIANVERDAPAPTVQETTTAESGGASTQAVTANRAYTCTEPGTLRNDPNSFVMGWCEGGALGNTRVDITSGDNSGWQKGYVYGGYSGCGWLQTSAHPLTAGGSFSGGGCGSSFIAASSFITGYNAVDKTSKPFSCPIYANVRPWSTGSTSGWDQVGTLPASSLVTWRYLTRNSQWINIRYPAASVGGGPVHSWAFVAAGCVDLPNTIYTA